MAFGFNDKDIERVAKTAIKLGWDVKVSGGNHVKWLSPDGETFLTSALTCNSQSWANFKVLLRRHGLLAHKNQKKKINR